MGNLRRIGEPWKCFGGLNGRIGSTRPGGGAASSFVPTDAPGLRLWLDANDISTLFQDAGRTIPVVADGNSIGGWSDKSGVGNHVIQPAGGNQPTYRVGIQNGLPIARFDGNDYLSGANAFTVAASGSLIAAFILRGIVGQDVVFSISVAAAGNQFSQIMPSYAPPGFPNTGIRMRNVGNDRTVTGNTVILVNTPYIHEWHATGATYRFFVNGNDEVENAVVGANDGAWHNIIAGANSTTIGARQSAGIFNDIQADFCEMLLYDGDMTAYYADIRNYLNDKWAVY
jgi:hypothetical protein